MLSNDDTIKPEMYSYQCKIENMKKGRGPVAFTAKDGSMNENNHVKEKKLCCAVTLNSPNPVGYAMEGDPMLAVKVGRIQVDFINNGKRTCLFYSRTS